MTLSEALKEAYADNTSNDIILNTIEIRYFVENNVEPDAIRIVLDNQNHFLRLENNAPLNPGQDVEFIAGYFDLVLPAVKEKEISQMQLSIDGVSSEIAGYIEQASETNKVLEATYRLYLFSNLLAPEMEAVHGSITNISVDIYRVTGNISFIDFVNKEFPRLYYSAKTFPGLT